MGANKSTLLEECKKEKPSIRHVKRLIAKGVWIDECDNYNCTPLYYACIYKHVPIALMLINAGANVNYTTCNGKTIFFSACKYTSPEIIVAMLPYVNNINQRDNDGDTPLIAACRAKNTPVIRILVELEGIQMNIVGKNNHTAMGVAKSTNKDIIIEIIRNAGGYTKKEYNLIQRQMRNRMPRNQRRANRITSNLQWGQLANGNNYSYANGLLAASNGARNARNASNARNNHNARNDRNAHNSNNVINYNVKKKCILCRKESRNFIPVFKTEECPICYESCDKIVSFQCGHLNCCEKCFVSMQ